MKTIISIIFILLSFSSLSQNLIKNGSIEELDVTCVVERTGYGNYPVATNVFAFTGTPDILNECSGVGLTVYFDYQVDIPYNFMGYQWARTGRGIAGYCNSIFPSYDNNKIGPEVLTMFLSDSLIPNKKYCMRFFTVLSDSVGQATDAHGAALSSESHMNNPDQMSYYSSISNLGKGFITDAANWVPVFDTIIATGNELYMHIGRFHYVDSTNITTVNTQAKPWTFPGYYYLYYYVDDVALWPADTIPPIANAGNDTIICKGDSAFVGGHNYSDYYYSWSDGNTLLQRDEHKGKLWVKPQQSKWFYVTATDFKYDKTIDSVFVTVKICGNDTLGIGTSTPLSVPGIRVYPNPANDEIIIEISGDYADVLNYELYSIDGRILQKANINNKSQNKIDIKGIDAGIYILKILNNKELIYNNKLIKK